LQNDKSGRQVCLQTIYITALFINQSINQSITFARAPVTGDHWCRTSNLIKSIDKKPMKLTNMSIANSKIGELLSVYRTWS